MADVERHGEAQSGEYALRYDVLARADFHGRDAHLFI